MRELCVFVQLNASLIHALELGVPHVISLTSSGDVTMTVTLIDARHCPGSVMFLFDGYFGRILYTGNFRYEDGMLDHGCLSELKSNPVDVLYIDNTFCSPKCVLPSRQEAKRQITDVIEQHPRKRVVFGLRGLGKEDILISLAKWFNVKITVSKERYRLLEVLALHEQFVMACEGSEQTRFEVVELVEITRSSVDVWNTTKPTIAILLTGLFVGLGYQPFTGSMDIFVVPLSDHSPYAELHEFVARIRPKFVVPIVRTEPGSRDDPLAASLLDRTNVECFAEYLDQSPMQNYHIPLSVLEMMNRTGSQTRKQAASCRKSVSDVSSTARTSRQKLSRNSSSLEKLSSSVSSVISDTVVAASDRQSDCVRWKRMNACHTVTSRIIRKPRVAVRPMRRCFLSRDRCLQSGFVKQRQSHCDNFPASFELRQNRFVTNEMLQHERKRVLLSRCMANSRVLSMATKLNVFPAADVFSLEQSNGTRERHPDMLVIANSNEACNPVSTINCAHSVSGSDDNGSQNCAGSLWKSTGNPVPAVLQVAEPQTNSGGTVTNSVVSHQESCEYIKKRNTLGHVLPRLSVMVLNHSDSDVRNVDVDGALNLITSGTAIAQPASHQIPDLLLNPGKYSNDSLQPRCGDSSNVLEDFPVQAISRLREQLCLESFTADTMSSLDDGTEAGNVSVPCNQMHRVAEAKHNTDAVEITQLLASMSRPPVDISYDTVSPVNASVNRFVDTSAGKGHPSIQLEAGVTLGNCCETAVLACDRSNADADVLVHTGLSDVVDASEDLPLGVVEDDTGIHCLPISDTERKLNWFDYKQGELQCNIMVAPCTQEVTLPPKKKWRKQFRAAQLPRLHQENRQQLNVGEGQKLSAKRPFSALESSKSRCYGISLDSSISSVNICPQSSICPAAKRVPLLTNYCAVADMGSRSVTCTSCHKTMPHVTGVARSVVSDCVMRHTSSGNDNRMKEQLKSSLSNWDQQKSTAVATSPLDLSVCRKSVNRNGRLVKDVPKTVPDVALFR